MNSCDHKYVLLDGKKYTRDAGYQTRWVRIDIFFCEKCLEKKTIKEEKYSRDTPEWY